MRFVFLNVWSCWIAFSAVLGSMKKVPASESVNTIMTLLCSWEMVASSLNSGLVSLSSVCPCMRPCGIPVSRAALPAVVMLFSIGLRLGSRSPLVFRSSVAASPWGRSRARQCGSGGLAGRVVLRTAPGLTGRLRAAVASGQARRGVGFCVEQERASFERAP